MLILASGSQSRKNLLENSNIEFVQISSDFDEFSIKDNNIKNLAFSLSAGKAKNVLEKIYKFKLNINSDISSFQILGCDSIFEFQGRAFGKPLNKKEAFERWEKMSSNYGYLHTGHTLLFCDYVEEEDETKIKINSEINEVITSKVLFSELTRLEIQKYVDSLEPLSCAGGFALEGRGGKLIEKVEGCFSNIMGLSLPWLRKELLKKGILA